MERHFHILQEEQARLKMRLQELQQLKREFGNYSQVSWEKQCGLIESRVTS